MAVQNALMLPFSGSSQDLTTPEEGREERLDQALISGSMISLPNRL